MIVIAPDKFKGSLTALEAAHAIAEGLRDGGCREEIALCPMADGGEGMPDRLGGSPVVSACDHVGYANAGVAKTDVMDRSSAPLGRSLRERYGMERSDAPRRIWLAVGGTLTVDGGAGALGALGVRFYDRSGGLIKGDVTAAMLPDLARCECDPRLKEYWRSRLFILSDVNATLTGAGLSALDFAVQKGVKAKRLPSLGKSLENLRRVLGSPLPSAVDGAGGGIGFAFASFIGAPCGSGAEAMLRAAGIDWQKVTLLISGEGSIDCQTAGGKVVETLRREAKRRGVPFIAVGGYVEPSLRDSTTISTIDSREDYDPRLAAQRLRQSTAAVARSLMSADDAPTMKSHTPL